MPEFEKINLTYQTTHPMRIDRMFRRGAHSHRATQATWGEVKPAAAAIPAEEGEVA